MGTITLNESQQRRASILSRVSSGAITVQQAAGLLHVSERQVRRLLVRFRLEGLPSVVHGNTGCSALNRISEEVRTRVSALAGKEGKYSDFNTCHMQEMLAEHEGITIGRSTLDRLLTQLGVRKRKRGRPRRVFHRRERVGQEGEMLLTDASPHDWLEGRDPRFKGHRKRLCLIGAVDDATGNIKHLRFWPTECQAGYITMAREVVTAYGIPMSFYHDRHTILVSPNEATIEDELAGREPMSQFQAILHQLGAESIRALTPQAKGRIERMWQTLQDRLIKEMRLAGVTTLEEANAFLPRYIERYNARFAVAPRDPEPAWVKPETQLDPSYYFSAKQERMVRADHTLSWKGELLLIRRKRGEKSLAGERVQVHTTPEGERFLYFKKKQLAFEAVTKRPHPPQRQVPVAPIGNIGTEGQQGETAQPNDPKRQSARRRQMNFCHQGIGRCGPKAIAR
jgi:transposase